MQTLAALALCTVLTGFSASREGRVLESQSPGQR